MTWPIRKINDVAIFLNSRRVPVKAADRAKRQGPYPYYGASGIVDWVDEYIFDGEYLLISEDGENLRSRNAPIAFLARGKYWVNNHAHILDEKEPGVLKYLSWALNRTDLSPYITGAAQPKLNKRTLADVEIAIPPLAERLEINATLGALDDKIELNRRMSATLEEMARALYRSWFVDFDPVHARALGQSPAHMDPATAALFPDSFGPDGLPKGWVTSSVNDIFDVVMGQSPPGNTYNDDGDGLPFFQGRTDFGFRYPENRKFCSAPSRVAEAESVLLSVRAPVGDLNRAWERCCVGRGVSSLAEKKGRTSFGYYTMWALSAELLSYDSEGTVFGAINKKQLLGLSIITAPAELWDRFEEIVAPIDSRIRNLTSEIRTLAALRDTLLPRLMSGELRIREAEKQVEEVV